MFDELQPFFHGKDLGFPSCNVKLVAILFQWMEIHQFPGTTFQASHLQRPPTEAMRSGPPKTSHLNGAVVTKRRIGPWLRPKEVVVCWKKIRTRGVMKGLGWGLG